MPCVSDIQQATNKRGVAGPQRPPQAALGSQAQPRCFGYWRRSCPSSIFDSLGQVDPQAGLRVDRDAGFDLLPLGLQGAGSLVGQPLGRPRGDGADAGHDEGLLGSAEHRLQHRVGHGGVLVRFDLALDARGAVEPAFSADEFRDSILGKSMSDARLAIAALPALADGTISAWPAWLGNIPSNKDKIQIVAN